MNTRYQRASWNFLRFSVGALALAAAMVMWNAYPTFSHANEALTPVEGADSPASLAHIIEAVRPAVVNISVSGVRPQAAPSQQFGGELPEGAPFDDFMRRFFDGRQPEAAPDRNFEAMGTGFIVDAEGLVVTNYHVVESAEEITVIMDDGSRHSATLRGHDDKTDLALLDIEGSDLPYVAFGDSDEVRAGDWIVAIGNPFGLGGTATTGIVSARGRDIQSGPYDDFLQIDAPINRGNSGGPLFDLDGKVIGVNTAIFSPSGGNVGIGFAIPSAQVQPVIEELRDKGKVERGWLGVSVQDLNDDLAAGLGLESADGALVAEVVAGSPAADAGVVTGDVIVGFNGEPVTEVRELVRRVGASDPGDDVSFEVWRRGEVVELGANLRALADTGSSATPAAASESRLGLRLADLDDALRQRLGVDAEVEGVVVRGVAEDSTAAQRGLRAGDVIVGVGQALVDGIDSYEAAIKEVEDAGRDTVVLQVLRGEARQFVALPLS